MVRLFSTRQRVLEYRVLVGVFSLVCVSRLCTSARAQEPQVGVYNLQQDSSGQVWGSGTFNGKGTGAIYTWERNAWRAHGLNLGANSASSDVSQRTARGAVVYLWNTRWWEESKNEAIVTQHSGTTSRVVARGKMSPSTQTIFQSARGTTWLTTGQKIYRVVGQKIQIEYSIAKAQFRRAAASAETQDETNPLQMSEDVRGRIYFWSNTLLGGTNYRSLRGILIFDGKKWTHLPRITGAIAGAADKPLTVFQAKDARHFWMAVGEEALYQFDIETRRAQKIAEPQKGAFKWVHKIERSGSDWFVFCERPETAYPDGDSSLRSNDLWRLRRGKWQKIVTGLDGGGEFSEFSNRAFLPDKNGLWIGSLWGGIWFVPQTPSGKTASGKVGVARRFDWRDGFDLLATNRLFRLRDGRIAAFNLGGYGARIGADVRPFLRTRPTSAYATSAYATFTSYGSLARDARGHLWRVPNLAARTLQEWNGQSWISHSVPRAYVLNRLSHLSVDARGRVWLLPDFRDEKAAFFDVKTGSWRVFPSLQKALQEELKQFGWRAAENLKIGDGSEYSKPRFAAPGRIVFRSESEKIVAFDGKIWRSWTRKQIKRDSSPGETSFDDAPSFSESGNLRINIEGQIWEWTPDAGWQASDEAAETNPNEGLDLVAPKGGPASRPESIARDDSGAIWITFERQLYKAAFGLWAPQLSPRERHPFQDGRSIKAVLRDSRGNLFLETGYSGEETVILPPRAPLPTTRIAVRKTAVDRAEFAFSTTATGKHWFRWRLDGGAWSAVSTRSVMQLRDLPGGEHKLEAQTIDRFLQTDLSPAKASFRVNIQATQQIESFIAALRSPDYAEREAAVVALSRQPQSALPALRRAQERSLVQSPDNTDERWWLDAAIQRIENAR